VLYSKNTSTRNP